MIFKKIAVWLESSLKNFISKSFKKPLNPNILTSLTLFFGVLAGISCAMDYIRLGGVFIAVSGLCDISDGVLARKFQRETKFGAFLDSVIDRYSELLIYGGLLLHYFLIGQFLNILLIYAVVIGALLTSYTRARAESLEISCKIGIIKRPGRIILLSLGALLNLLPLFLWIIAILTNIAALQRIYFVYRYSENK